MTLSYVNSAALTDWQRGLTALAGDIEAPVSEGPLRKIRSAVSENPHRIELHSFVALLETLASQTMPSSVAWQIGLSQDWSPGSDIAKAVLGCRTLGSALSWMCSFFPLLQDSAYLKLDVGEDWATLSYKILDPTVWPRHEDAMFTLGIYARMIKATAPDVWGQVQVTVESEQSQIGVGLEPIVGTAVVYGGQSNAIRFPRALIDLPMRLAPPCQSDVFKKLSASLSRKMRRSTMVYRTRQIIYRRLTDGALSQNQIARQLGMSSRTLRRKLSKEGHSFQRLLDQCRMEFAAFEFRTRQESSLSDMALRLGYSEHSTFSRAFSRWAGMAPQDYRKRVAGAASQ